MYQIENITKDPKQIQTLLLPDGSGISFELVFVDMQLGWFFNLIYGSFVLSGMRVVNSPNILRQFKNQIPFGLACFSKNDREPSLIKDFISGASKLYVLNADEVQEYEDLLNGQT